MPEPWNKYDLTAARRHGRPGRIARPSSVTVDVHSHVAVPAADALVTRHMGAAGPSMARFATPETRELGQRHPTTKPDPIFVGETLKEMIEQDVKDEEERD